MSPLPKVVKSNFIPLLSTLVLFLSVFVGVSLVQQQQEIRTKAAGNTYYVAQNGSDGNPGTLSKPWRTIAKANSTLQAGDTVRIRSGTYNEVIEPSRSGTSGNPIIYTNYQNEEAIIRGNNTQKYLARLRGSYTVIDSLTFRHGFRVQGQSGWISIESGSSRFNIIRNNKIITEDAELQWSLSKKDKYKDRGIIVKRAKDTLIESNLIRGMQIGVSVWRNGQRTIIRGNTITETFQSPIVVGGSTGTPTIQGILIENNVLEKSLIEDGIQFHQNFDLPKDQWETDVSAMGIVVRSNIIRYNAENAIDLKSAGNVVIEGNIIYGTVGSNDGPLFGWNRNSLNTIMRGSRTSTRDVIIRNNVLYDNASGMRLYDGFRVYNNTLLANNRDFTGSNSAFTTSLRPVFYGIRQLRSDIAIKNNIVVNHSSAEVVVKTNTGSNDINNNLYYNTNGVFLADSRASNNWDRIPFSQWTSYLQGFSRISGKDAQSIVCKPEFVNVPSSLKPVGVHTNFDFRYTGNCPLVGAPLTQTIEVGSGRQIRVKDARFFFDGYGIVAGDQIIVGNNSPVAVTAINYSTNIITVDRSISWKSNDPVTLRFPGSTPPVGAFEFGSVGGPPPPPPPGPSPTPTNTPAPTPPPTGEPTNTPTPPGPNVIRNPGFEAVDSTGKPIEWKSFSDGSASFTASGPGTEGTRAAKFSITTQGGNVQVYQFNLELEANSDYVLTFDAFSNTGHDMEVLVHKHGSPYTNYGLASDMIDLGTSWKNFSIPFTTNGLGGVSSVNDARLRFWFAPYDSAGDVYWIDNVVLAKAGAAPPPPLLPGDIDKDGDVDIFDYNILIENFGNTNCGNVADIDGNCKVDIFDYNLLIENFGRSR